MSALDTLCEFTGDVGATSLATTATIGTRKFAQYHQGVLQTSVSERRTPPATSCLVTKVYPKVRIPLDYATRKAARKAADTGVSWATSSVIGGLTALSAMPPSARPGWEEPSTAGTDVRHETSSFGCVYLPYTPPASPGSDGGYSISSGNTGSSQALSIEPSGSIFSNESLSDGQSHASVSAFDSKRLSIASPSECSDDTYSLGAGTPDYTSVARMVEKTDTGNGTSALSQLSDWSPGSFESSHDGRIALDSTAAPESVWAATSQNSGVSPPLFIRR